MLGDDVLYNITQHSTRREGEKEDMNSNKQSFTIYTFS